MVETYFRDEGGKILDDNGFFDTGDVATIDPNGFMQITDRAKDVIKSGGEWISTIDIENFAVGHPDVAEAAVIGVHHPKWDERPLLVIVPKEGCDPKTEDVLAYLKPKIAKWWMPDDMQVVTEIPHTATGKINKMKLRESFKGYKLPTDGESRRPGFPASCMRLERSGRPSASRAGEDGVGKRTAGPRRWRLVRPLPRISPSAGARAPRPVLLGERCQKLACGAVEIAVHEGRRLAAPPEGEGEERLGRLERRNGDDAAVGPRPSTPPNAGGSTSAASAMARRSELAAWPLSSIRALGSERRATSSAAARTALRRLRRIAGERGDLLPNQRPVSLLVERARHVAQALAKNRVSASGPASFRHRSLVPDGQTPRNPLPAAFK